MPERSVVHSTFTIERTYEPPPARVFAAWADPSLKSRWFGGGTDDAPLDLDMDFRVGGHETDRSDPGAYQARYHDIVQDERIVFTYELSLGGSLVSVSLATVEFRPVRRPRVTQRSMRCRTMSERSRISRTCRACARPR